MNLYDETEIKRLLNMEAALAALRFLIPRLETRIRTIRLLDRIEDHRGALVAEERCIRDKTREQAAELFRRLKGGKMPEQEDGALVGKLSRLRYMDEFGREHPWTTVDEASVLADAGDCFLADRAVVGQAKITELLDTYAALTEGNPRNPPSPPEQAVERLHAMTEEGWFDKELVGAFAESGAWKAVVKEEQR